MATPFIAPPRVNILGVGISALNLPLAVDLILGAVAEHRAGYVTVSGVHGIIAAQDDPTLRDIFNSSMLSTPDGMPTVWLGRLAGHSSMGRVYGPDLMLALCDAGRASGLRHFLYGGNPGVAEELRDALCRRFPGLQVTGCYTPPYRPLNDEEEAELAARVASARPDIIWVGISTPRQERFMAAHVGRLGNAVLIGVGAAFDFHTGRVRQAPRWVQRIGMEWFFRLCCEPKRLWRRYLTTNPRFLALTFLQLTGLRKYPDPAPRS